MNLKTLSFAVAMVAVVVTGCGGNVYKEASFKGPIEDTVIVNRTLSGKGYGHKFSVNNPDYEKTGESQQKELHEAMIGLNKELDKQVFKMVKTELDHRNIKLNGLKNATTILLVDLGKMKSFCSGSISASGCKTQMFYIIHLHDTGTKKMLWRKEVMINVENDFLNKEELGSKLANQIINGLIESSII